MHGDDRERQGTMTKSWEPLKTIDLKLINGDRNPKPLTLNPNPKERGEG